MPVYAYGKIIGTRTVYNDRLLMFMLRNRAPRRFAAHTASGMNAVDRAMLTRLKKEWRREWERERHKSDEADKATVLASLSAKIDLMRAREEEVRQMLLEEAGREDEDEDDEDDEDHSTELPPEKRYLLPRARLRVVDDGWEVLESDAGEDVAKDSGDGA